MTNEQRKFMLDLINKEIEERESSLSYRRGSSRDWAKEEIEALKILRNKI